MTSPSTPTKEPTSAPATQESSGVETASPRARDARRLPDPRRSSTWLGWAGIAAALAAAIWLVIAGVTADYETGRSARANQASTDRLQGFADQYETARHARANQASTARLEGFADQYETARSARASQAATDRLQGLADQYDSAP